MSSGRASIHAVDNGFLLYIDPGHSSGVTRIAATPEDLAKLVAEWADSKISDGWNPPPAETEKSATELLAQLPPRLTAFTEAPGACAFVDSDGKVHELSEDRVRGIVSKHWRDGNC